jgi:hypothetical protein
LNNPNKRLLFHDFIVAFVKINPCLNLFYIKEVTVASVDEKIRKFISLPSKSYAETHNLVTVKPMGSIVSANMTTVENSSKKKKHEDTSPESKMSMTNSSKSLQPRRKKVSHSNRPMYRTTSQPNSKFLDIIILTLYLKVCPWLVLSHQT